MLCLLGYGASSLASMALSECSRPPSFSLLSVSRFTTCKIICQNLLISFPAWQRFSLFQAEAWHKSHLRTSRQIGGDQLGHFRSTRGSANVYNSCRCFSSSPGQHFENGALTSSDGEISVEEYSETVRLVETAMLAAAVGLAYFLSTLLRIENYFGCFFPLPLVISSLRWGAAAGRKTMVATAMLLLVLSGPLKVASYLLMHGFVGLAMGTLWRSGINWGFSVLLCTLVRSLGAMGSVFLSSWLLRDNILALIMINAHASISYMFAAVGINVVPSMGSIYFIFGTLVLLNSGSFVFLLHVLYALFLKRLGLNPSLIFPAWLKNL